MKKCYLRGHEQRPGKIYPQTLQIQRGHNDREHHAGADHAGIAGADGLSCPETLRLREGKYRFQGLSEGRCADGRHHFAATPARRLDLCQIISVYLAGRSCPRFNSNTGRRFYRFPRIQPAASFHRPED